MLGAAPAADPAITERYWALHENMRGEFLADLEEYLGLQRMIEQKRGGPISAQHSEKAARIMNIIARLSVSCFPSSGCQGMSRV